jgi:hypothetical protein
VLEQDTTAVESLYPRQKQKLDRQMKILYFTQKNFIGIGKVCPG